MPRGRRLPRLRRDAMTAPPPSEAGGTPFGPYRLLREIGRGGMGTVYLAEIAPPAASSGPAPDEEVSHEIRTDEVVLLLPGTRVAVKTFHPHLVETQDFARRFRREARVGASIHHPNVVRTYDAGTAALSGRATNYLAMEYVEGQTLRDLMRESGRLAEEFARTIARQVAAGLDAIHRTGITHRDLKPENVILTSDHRVKLMDLGVAKVREASIRLSLTGQFLGSVHYASPEQFRAPETVDARADVYALGVLLYEMLSGTNPFLHDDLRVVLRRTLTETPRRLSQVVPEVPPVLDQLAATLMEKDPADRVPTAGEVLDVLERGEESDWWRDRGRHLWAASAGRVVRRMSVAREAPLVGRDTETATLRRLFDRAAAGQRTVVLVEGEAGVGKTRLLDEFAASLAEAGVRFRFLFGAAPQPGTGRAYHAFSDALLQACGGEEPSSALARLLPADAPASAFAALVTGAPGASLPRDQARSLFAAAFRALAAEEPLLLVVDDLHLADEDSVHLFSYLAHDERSTPLLLVGAYRPPEESAPLHALALAPREGHVHPLPLGRLGPKEIGLLLRSLLRSEHLVQELGFRLLEKTEGNPYFVLEVLRSLQQDQVLARRDDGAWTLAGTKVEIHVPDSVREVVQTNLARLADEDRDVLDAASVLGTEFDPEVLAEMLGTPKIALLKRLAAIERRHRLIRAVGRRVRFDHHQLRETILEGLMEGLREEYHAQAGTVLERRLAGRAADGATHLELLRHFLHGGRAAEAEAHLLPGLRHAASLYRTEEGIALAERYLARETTGETLDPRRAEVLLLLAEMLEHEGRREEEEFALVRARAEQAASEETQRRVLERLVVLDFATGDHAGAEAACRRQFQLAARRKDRDAALAALANLATAMRCRGRYDAAARALRRALAFLIADGSTLRRCLVTSSLALVEMQRGRGRTAQKLFLEAVGLAVPFGIGKAGDLAASRHPEEDELHDRFLGLSRALARHAESRADGERLLLTGSAVPRRLGEAAALLSLGVVAGHLGQDTDARGLLLGALQAARDAEDPRFQATVLHALGENALQSRAPDVARRWFEEALELRRRIGFRPGVCETLLALGQVAALGGSVDAARLFLEEATDLAPMLRMPAIAALARATSALLHAREGRRDRARAELEEARQALSGPGPLSVSSRVEGLWFAALAARALGDEDAFRDHVHRAWEILREVSGHMGPDERRAFLLGTSPHREIVEAAGGVV